MRTTIACVAALIAFDARAADFPTAGLLHNQREDASLSYSCSIQSSQRLRCEFVQTSVRKKAKPAELPNKLADARKSYPTAKKEFSDPKECDWIANFVGVATGQLPIETMIDQAKGGAVDKGDLREKMLRIQQDAKDDPAFLDGFITMRNLCRDPSETNFLKFTEAAHKKDLKTCFVSSHPFTQEFVWVSDFGNSGAWVVSNPPEGPCGVVQLSRFEKDATEKSGLFWRYIARKAVTNPSGTFMPGMSCSDLDQSEYLYDWRRSRSEYMQCQYVEFSPF